MLPQPMKTWPTPRTCISTALGNLTMLCEYNEFYELELFLDQTLSTLEMSSAVDEAQDCDSYCDGSFSSTHCTGICFRAACFECAPIHILKIIGHFRLMDVKLANSQVKDVFVFLNILVIIFSVYKGPHSKIV